MFHFDKYGRIERHSRMEIHSGIMMEMSRAQFKRSLDNSRIKIMVSHAKRAGKQVAASMVFRKVWEVTPFEIGQLRVGHGVQGPLIEVAVKAANEYLAKRKREIYGSPAENAA